MHAAAETKAAKADTESGDAAQGPQGTAAVTVPALAVQAQSAGITWAKVVAKWPHRCLDTFLAVDDHQSMDLTACGKVTRSSYFLEKVIFAVGDKVLDVINAQEYLNIRIATSGSGEVSFSTDFKPPKAAKATAKAKANAIPSRAKAAAKAAAKGDPANVKFYFGGPLGLASPGSPAPSLPVATVSMTNTDASATISVSGCLLPGSHVRPSLAWLLPTSSDAADCTLDLCTEELKVVVTTGPVKTDHSVTLHYLKFSESALNRLSTSPSGSFAFGSTSASWRGIARPVENPEAVIQGPEDQRHSNDPLSRRTRSSSESSCAWSCA